MTAGAPGEKRRSRRLRWDLHVSVKGPDGRDSRLMSYDWTGSSVFLRTNEPFANGTVLELGVLAGHPSRPVTLAGSVTRVVLSDAAPPNSPRGMVVSFADMPALLRHTLQELTRARGAPVPVAATPVRAAPAALVITSDQRFGADTARALTHGGYEVTGCGSEARARLLLDAQLRPRLWVFHAETVAALHPLTTRYALTNPPQLVVIVGDPPDDFSRGRKCPIVMLPLSWPVERLPEVVAVFLPSGESSERGAVAR